MVLASLVVVHYRGLDYALAINCAERIIEEKGHLNLIPLAQQAGVSIHTVQRDVNAWVAQGWLDRHGTGTYIYWRLPGQGPLADHVPICSERVERIITDRRDLNTAVLAGQAVRVRFGSIVWLSLPLPESLDWADWGKPVLALARKGECEGQEKLLKQWQWDALSKALPVTAGEAAKIWSIGTATARQRLAALVTAGG